MDSERTMCTHRAGDHKKGKKLVEQRRKDQESGRWCFVYPCTFGVVHLKPCEHKFTERKAIFNKNYHDPKDIVIEIGRLI